MPTLVAVLALSLLTRQSLQQWSQAQRFELALKLSEELSSLLSLQADERGWTTLYLRRGRPMQAQERSRLRELRSRGDQALDRCIQRFRRLQGDEVALNRLIRARSQRNQQRERVDGSSPETAALAAGEFFAAQCHLIESELGLDTLLASMASEAGEASFVQNRLRNRLKLIIEFAARERGILAGCLAARQPPDESTLSQLKGWRQVVEVHQLEVLNLARNFDLPASVAEPLNKARADFLGPLEALRQRAYGPMLLAGLGEEAFFQGYSSVLNQFNKVSEACQKEAEAISKGLQQQARFQQLGLAALSLLLLLTALAMLRSAQAIARPLLRLAEASKALVHGEVLGSEGPEDHGQDELAELRRAFHQMAVEISSQRERLSEDRQRLSAIIENSPDFMSWATLDSVVHYLNPAGRALLGIEPEEDIRHYRIADFGPPESLSLLQEVAMPEARAMGSWRGEIDLVHRSGQRIPCELVVIVHRDEGRKVAYLSAIARDLRERREAQCEMQAALARAEQANQAKSHFLARMSHEFRTPLNAILGFGDMLQAENYGALQPKQQRALANINRASRHLLALVNDILDLARIEAGHDRLEPGPVDLRSLFEAVLELVSPLAEARSHELTIAAGGTAALWADEARLQQVLLNLLGNAVKFTPPGGHIQLDWEVLPGGLEIRVQDDGPGIAEEDQQRIFVDFEQAQLGLNRAQEGTGLGLSLSRRLVELMGGRIGVRSQPGQGAQFWLLLPLAKTQE